MNKSKIKISSIAILISIILVAVLGSVFVNMGMEWYSTLSKPAMWIPNFVIPIVWTIVYISFAVVLFIWNNKTGLPKSTTILLIINGVLNVLWCFVFFTLHQTLLGNITIILNLIAGYLLLADIYKSNKVYAFILFLYPIWLSIATTLNNTIWTLN